MYQYSVSLWNCVALNAIELSDPLLYYIHFFIIYYLLQVYSPFFVITLYAYL